MAAVPEVTDHRALLDVLEAGALEAAPALLGLLVVTADASARIVEVEAYGRTIRPRTAAAGPRPRTAPMFGPPGCWYVYFSYGMHWCANVTCGPPGRGEAVLLRAALPVSGLDALRARRGPAAARATPARLLDGPAKLAQGLALTGADSGRSALAPGAEGGGDGGAHLVDDGIRLPVDRVTPRIGISVATERLWRFCAAGAPARTPHDRVVPRPGRGAR